MNGDIWNQRRKALEESFFSRRNAQLLERLRTEMAEEETKRALSSASGITDETVLEQLVAAGISGDSLAVVSLVPVILVAWADGKMQAPERKAILSAGASEGIRAGSVSHELLTSWLEEQPDADALFEAWKSYAALIVEGLSDPAADAFRERIVGRARRVAKAAGGILGVHAISGPEQAVLDDLQSALSN